MPFARNALDDTKIHYEVFGDGAATLLLHHGFSRSIADYPSMYAAIFSIILLAVLFLNLLEKTELMLFKGNNRGYVSD